MRERWQKSCSVCVCVWKHTLAALFPPSPETRLQNQEVKSTSFLNQKQETQQFPPKPSDFLREQEIPFPLKPADCIGQGFTSFFVRFADKKSNFFSDSAVSPFQARMIHHYEALNRLSGYSDTCHFTMPEPIYQIAAQCPVYSKGGSLPHAFH